MLCVGANSRGQCGVVAADGASPAVIVRPSVALQGRHCCLVAAGGEFTLAVVAALTSSPLPRALAALLAQASCADVRVLLEVRCCR